MNQTYSNSNVLEMEKATTMNKVVEFLSGMAPIGAIYAVLAFYFLYF